MSKLKNAEQLMQEIDFLFPFTALPEIKTLTVHYQDCVDCEHLHDYFKAYKDSYFDNFEQKLFDLNELIIRTNFYLPILSSIGFYWILPHCIRYAINSTKDDYSWSIGYRENLGLMMSLNGDSTSSDNFLRFSLLSKEQIIFIINFLKWFRELANGEFFEDSYNEYIDLAINFLQKLKNYDLYKNLGG